MVAHDHGPRLSRPAPLDRQPLLAAPLGGTAYVERGAHDLGNTGPPVAAAAGTLARVLDHDVDREPGVVGRREPANETLMVLS